MESEIFYRHGWSIPYTPLYPLMIYLFAGLFYFFDRFIFSGAFGPWTYYVHGPLTTHEAMVIACLFCFTVSIATIWMVYAMSKRLLGRWPAIAVLSFIVFSPIHILNAHYPYSDTVVTFFIVLELLLAFKLYLKSNVILNVSAGVIFALACAVKTNAVFLFFPVLVAQILYRLEHPEQRKAVFCKSISAFFCSALITYLILTPYFLKDVSYFWRIVLAGTHDQYNVVSIHKFIDGIWRIFRIFIEQYGVCLIGVSILAVFLNTLKRKLYILIAYPIAYIVALGNNHFIIDRYFDPFTPFLAILPIAFLCWLIERLRCFKTLRLWLVIILMSFTLFQPVLTSLEFSWLFSQKDTRIWAGEWVKENVPKGSKIMMFKNHYDAEITGDSLESLQADKEDSFKKVKAETDFYSINGMIGPRPSWKNSPVHKVLVNEYIPLKKFDLRRVSFFQIPIVIYYLPISNFSPENMIYLPPQWILGSSYELIFKGHVLPYGKEATAGIYGAKAQQRFVVSDTPLPMIAVQLFSGPFSGQAYGKIGGKKYNVRLDAYDEKVICGGGKRGFPYPKWIYKILINASQTIHRKFGFQILTKTYDIGHAALEAKQFDLAIEAFQKAREDAASRQDLLYWLALSYEGADRLDMAYQTWKQAVKRSALEPWFSLSQINDDDLFDKEYMAMTSVDPSFYREIGSRVFQGDDLHMQSGTGQKMPWKKKPLRYHSFQKHKAGFIMYGPYCYLPRGFYRCAFYIRSGPVQNKKSVARIEVYSKEAVISQRMLNSEDFIDNSFQNFDILFYNQYPWQTLEFRLFVDQCDVWVLDEIKIEPDLRGHLVSNLIEFFKLGSRMERLYGNLKQRVLYLEKALQLDPNCVEVLLDLAECDVQNKKREEAKKHLLAILERIPNHITALRNLCALGPQVVENIDMYQRRLNDLTPSTPAPIDFERDIRFLGYDLSPKSTLRGGQLHISYYWLCQTKIPGPLTVFVHVQGEKDSFQMDHDPQEGRYKTHHWIPGEIVKENYT
ncbi:MAG: tetratricopeptide repeat protein, partial [Chlamydiota bacterium]|nr:tetratricopeptide repeat protein [Chlamydiota bacterium]